MKTRSSTTHLILLYPGGLFMSIHSQIEPELSEEEYNDKVNSIFHCYKDVYDQDVLYDDVYSLLANEAIIQDYPDSIIAHSDGNRVTTDGRAIESDKDRRAIARDLLTVELADRFAEAAQG